VYYFFTLMKFYSYLYFIVYNIRCFIINIMLKFVTRLEK